MRVKALFNGPKGGGMRSKEKEDILQQIGRFNAIYLKGLTTQPIPTSKMKEDLEKLKQLVAQYKGGKKSFHNDIEKFQRVLDKKENDLIKKEELQVNLSKSVEIEFHEIMEDLASLNNYVLKLATNKNETKYLNSSRLVDLFDQLKLLNERFYALKDRVGYARSSENKMGEKQMAINHALSKTKVNIEALSLLSPNPVQTQISDQTSKLSTNAIKSQNIERVKIADEINGVIVMISLSPDKNQLEGKYQQMLSEYKQIQDTQIKDLMDMMGFGTKVGLLEKRAKGSLAPQEIQKLTDEINVLINHLKAVRRPINMTKLHHPVSYDMKVIAVDVINIGIQNLLKTKEDLMVKKVKLESPVDNEMTQPIVDQNTKPTNKITRKSVIETIKSTKTSISRTSRRMVDSLLKTRDANIEQRSSKSSNNEAMTTDTKKRQSTGPEKH
jgi:hypothetical protein